MVCSKKYHRIFICFILLLTLFMGSSFTIKLETEQLSNEQVIYNVNNKDEAMFLAEKYHLSFNKLSSHGMALFDLTHKSNHKQLIRKGFAFNGTSKALSPTNSEIVDEDPRLKEQYALELMDTIEAWEITEGTNDITVAILDSGIDYDHEEFIGRVSPLSYNASTETVGLEAVDDDTGHGTMVAGIIGAGKNNGAGIAGIAPNIKILAIKTNIENENSYKDNALIEGIYYAVDNGADIINLSLGNYSKNIFMEIALNYAKNNGVIVVASAGNDGVNDPFYPAAYSSTIAVSAVNEYVGNAPYSNFGSYIDISAPGTRIMTTLNYNGYGTISGTSFASPQVSGVLALMLSYFPDLSSEEIIERLLLSTVDYGDEGIDPYFGHGLVNTYNALSYQIHKVTFNTYGGKTIDPIYQITNSKISPPNPPTFNDFEFLGWYIDFELTQPWDFENSIVTDNITLHAKYDKPSHEVTYISNYQIINTMIFPDGGIIALPNVSLEGHEFRGWTIDKENQIPLETNKVYNNLTLYAHFEPISYHDIHLYIDGELQESSTLESGLTYQPSVFNKTGYSFDGWYLDDDYTIEYDSSQPIKNDLNLYGKFKPNNMTVTLMLDGQVYQTLDVRFDQIISLPQPIKDSTHFVGWYFSDAYEETYQYSPITEDITLYGRFSSNANKVTYSLDGVNEIVWRMSNEIFEPFTPIKTGYIFMGWYTDQAYTNAYEVGVLSQDISLYGFFEKVLYTVKFYQADRESIFYETQVSYGESATPANQPEKNNSLNFTYTQWSHNTNQVTKDLNIYPIFKKQYIPESITLKPGLDTINEGDIWVDSGLSNHESNLTIKTLHDINNSVPGRHPVNYLIYDGEHIIACILRFVTIVETSPNLTIELNPGISSIPVGGQYIEAGATSSQGEVVIISNIDTSQAGTYRVIYQVNIDNHSFEKTRVIHVYELDVLNSTQIYWYKEERDQYVA